jgi:hypothetical protein
VVHEAVILFLFQRPDQLLIARGAECQRREDLRLAAREEA